MTEPLEPALAAAAKEARSWPFEEARRIVKRLETPQGRRRQDGDFRDRLRAVGAAAHRHLRRGGAHGHGAARVRDPDRRQDQDAADLLLRRHGRPAQGARQRAQQGHAGGLSRQAADLGARSVRQRAHQLRRPQQRDAARVSSTGSASQYEFFSATETYKAGTVRRDPAQDARGLRQGDGHHPADAGARAARHLFAVPARLARARARCCRCRWWSATPRRAPSSISIPTPARRWRRPSPAARSSASGRPTGPCAGRRSASTTRCAART